MKNNKHVLLVLFSGLLMFGGVAAWSSADELKPEEQKSALIQVSIKNHSSSTIMFTETNAVSDWRWITKGLQWLGNWMYGTVHTLNHGDEITYNIDPTKVLAFYRVDLSRTVTNVKQGVALFTAVSTACAGAMDYSATTTVSGVYKAKGAYGEMTRPGDRTCETIAPNSTIILLDPITSEDPSILREKPVEEEQPGLNNSAIAIIVYPPKAE